LGGKRLYKGLPCSPQETFGRFSRLVTLNIAGTDLPQQDIMAILAVSNIQSNLQSLYLGGNGLGEEGSQAIASLFLPMAKQLKKLDLRYNDINGRGMAALTRAIATAQCPVQCLYMEGNQIRDDGAQALAELLDNPRKSSIREVFLGANHIQAQGAQALAKTLYNNKAITKIYLEGNNIGLTGANSFSSVLEELEGDTGLTNLYVDNNNIGKEGSKRLAKALNSDTAIGDAIA